MPILHILEALWIKHRVSAAGSSLFREVPLNIKDITVAEIYMLTLTSEWRLICLKIRMKWMIYYYYKFRILNTTIGSQTKANQKTNQKQAKNKQNLL
jgi:hypothetical protein